MLNWGQPAGGHVVLCTRLLSDRVMVVENFEAQSTTSAAEVRG